MLKLCLNPCYSGRWSRRQMIDAAEDAADAVLILVIAVDGLGEEIQLTSVSSKIASLNPCYSGRWSRRGSSQIPL